MQVDGAEFLRSRWAAFLADLAGISIHAVRKEAESQAARDLEFREAA